MKIFESKYLINVHLQSPLSLSFKPLRLGQNVHVAFLEIFVKYVSQTNHSYAKPIFKHLYLRLWVESFQVRADIIQPVTLIRKLERAILKAKLLKSPIFTWLGKASLPKLRTRSFILNLDYLN